MRQALNLQNRSEAISEARRMRQFFLLLVLTTDFYLVVTAR